MGLKLDNQGSPRASFTLREPERTRPHLSLHPPPTLPPVAIHKMAIPQGECGAQEPRSLEGSAGVEAENRTWQRFSRARPPPGFFPFLKSPQFKKRLLPPSCRLPRGLAQGGPPGLSLAGLGCAALASVSLQCHRFHFRAGEKEERDRATEGKREGGSVRHWGSLCPHLAGPPPAAPSPDPPLVWGFSESRSRGQSQVLSA